MMWLNQRKLILFTIFLVSSIFLFPGGGHAQAGEKLTVFVSIPLQ